MHVRAWSSIPGALAVAMVVAMVWGTGVWAQGKWDAPADAKKVQNPVTKSAKVLAQGKKLMETNCVPCHGPKGLGDGPAAAALPVRPANWTAPPVQTQSDGELFWKITNGRGPMPPWKHLAEKDRWALIHYLRTLKK